MLTGVLHTCEAAIPPLIEQGEGGLDRDTSSVLGLNTSCGAGHENYGSLGYHAAKHGRGGLMRSYANSSPLWHPLQHRPPHRGQTPMLPMPSSRCCARTTIRAGGPAQHAPGPRIEAVDGSNAIVYLCQMPAGTSTDHMPVDAGATAY